MMYTQSHKAKYGHYWFSNFTHCLKTKLYALNHVWGTMFYHTFFANFLKRTFCYSKIQFYTLQCSVWKWKIAKNCPYFPIHDFGIHIFYLYYCLEPDAYWFQDDRQILNNIVDNETSLYELQTLEVSKCISGFVHVLSVWFYITFVLYSTEYKYQIDLDFSIILYMTEKRLLITDDFVVRFFQNVMLPWHGSYDIIFF